MMITLHSGKTKRDLESNKLKISHELLDSAFTEVDLFYLSLVQIYYVTLCHSLY